MKTCNGIVMAALVLLFIACDKDETRPLSAVAGTSSFDTLNACDIGSAQMATLFSFQITLASEPTIPIGGVEFDLEWSDGDKTDDLFDNSYSINGSVIEYDWCFIFGSTSWFEVRPVIVDADNKPLSNDVTIRVNKPAGAN